MYGFIGIFAIQKVDRFRERISRRELRARSSKLQNFCLVSIALDEQVKAWKRLSITCGTHRIRRRLSRRLS